MPGLTSPRNYPYPLYTEPVNGPAQIQALAQAINNDMVTQQANVAAALSRKSGRVVGLTNQSIPNLVTTTLSYVTEDFDTDNIFNLPGSATNAVIATAGHYLVIGENTFATNATGDRQIQIVKNGVPQSTYGQRAVTGVPHQIMIEDVINCAVADIVTLAVSQTSGGALNSTTRRFALYRISG